MPKTPAELLSLYVAFLASMYALNQENHWLTKGYANHLLFQRIYEGVNKMLDEAAEKAVGLFDTLKHQSLVSSMVEKFKAKYEGEESPLCCLKSSLSAELAFQKFAKQVYESIKEQGAMTLGLDDMIMAHCSQSELHVYLLKQSLKDNF
jgi:DNA-binding ferritin-like protein